MHSIRITIGWWSKLDITQGICSIFREENREMNTNHTHKGINACRRLITMLIVVSSIPLVARGVVQETEQEINAENLPARFDWREKNIMTPVKHQMNLGSCGVFAAVAVFESLIKKETGKTVDLSEQQIINGSRDWVPSGISSVNAMKYMKEHGLVLEERLPYQDKKSDEMPEGPPDYMLTDYQSVVTDKLALSDKIESIKKAVWKYGPVATNMIFYKDLDQHQKGIYVYDGESEEQGGHWIVIVGWADASEVKNGGYWICRNSWGNGWAEKGYFNIAYGECGIDDFWFVFGVFKPRKATYE